MYDREKAVAYARKWALGRNPDFMDFQTMGGDCTSFVSQCLYAGCGEMNLTPVYGWYFRSARDRTASWSGVKYLYQFLIGNRGAGPRAVEVPETELIPGDVIQLGRQDGTYYHSLFVVEAGRPAARDNILICAHTDDSLDRPLDTYFIEQMRCLHIQQ